MTQVIIFAVCCLREIKGDFVMEFCAKTLNLTALKTLIFFYY